MPEMICNIGPKQIQKRLGVGVVATILTLLFLSVTILTHEPWWARLPVFMGFWVAGLGFFQAQQKTCVAFAAKNVINMDQGEKPVSDADFLTKIRRKAKGIHRQALIWALALTLLSLLIRA
jgi:hypothetical protein